MIKKNLSKTEKLEFEYLIKVLSSAVNNSVVPLPFNEINWKRMIEISRICGFSSLFANTVLKLNDKGLISKELYSKLNEIKSKELLVDGVLNYEVENILRTFEKYKIKNVPLKGYFMKMEYPRPDFRSMSDFDILFDEKQLDDVKAAFSEIGYEFVHYDDNQFHFRKEPFIYIEMHKTLVHDYEYLYYPYLVDQINRTIKRKNYDYSYEMSYDDYYLYMLVHHSNHFRIGGMGIRMVLDIYIYYKNHKNDFNFEYLNERLKLFRLNDFENRIRQIAFDWFSESEPKIKFDNLETYILLSATLGRLDASVTISSHKSVKIAEKEGKRNSKFLYLLSCIFPSGKKLQYNYPYLNKFPFLLPAAWFSIWFRRFFILKNVNIKRGLKNRLSYTDDDVSYIECVFNEVGFNDFN